MKITDQLIKIMNDIELPDYGEVMIKFIMHDGQMRYIEKNIIEREKVDGIGKKRS